jgi:GT2 family glycosyltransferase
MTLTIVIVSWNARQDLEACLASIESNPPSWTHDIIVVDNASTDGAPAMVAARFPGVRLIPAGANLGFARANNIGMRAAGGDLLLLLNPDTRVPSAAVDRLIDRLEQTGVSAAGPRIVDDRGRAELSFGSMPGPLTELRQRMLVRLHQRGLRAVSAIVEERTRSEREVDWVSGACLLVRREAAEAVGLFDERYFLYWEDVDFCAALRARGGRILFAPAAEIVHAGGRSAALNPAGVNDAYRQAQLAFYAKHRPGWVPLLKSWLRARGQLPSSVTGL